MTYIPPPIPMRLKGRAAGKLAKRHTTPWRKPVYWKAALARRERGERQALARATRRSAHRVASLGRERTEMPLCTVCTHRKRREIDAALIEHAVGYRVVAGRFGLAPTSVQRHQNEHLAKQIRQSRELAMRLSTDNLLEQVGKWHERMEEQYRKADDANEIATAATVARVGLSAIESFAKLGALGEIEQRLKTLEEGSGASGDAH